MSTRPNPWLQACCFCLLAFGLTAQTKRANQWYFGSGSAINFNTTPPTLAGDHPMRQLEGSASISDEDGQLLFYTDGSSVWTRQHQVMPNGTGLLGEESSSQSALIVPKPGSSTLFYVFTTPAWGDARADGVRYSVVDLQLNNGMGDIVNSQKNVRLVAPTTEKLAAVLHGNGQDVWVVTSKLNTNQYYAYLVTAEGVCNCPVVSAVGQAQNNYQGYLKFSPDGTRIASAQAYGNLDLFGFDACTGVLSPKEGISTLNGLGEHMYGLSFSPDGSKLYVSTGWYGGDDGCAQLNQYDLNAPDVPGSRAVLFDNRTAQVFECGTSAVGAIQLGPDGKLYVANWGYPYLHVIHNPNARGPAANFVKDGFSLGNTDGLLGLPNFIESYFHPTAAPRPCAPSVLNADFGHDDGCSGQPVHFVDQSATQPAVSLCYEWDFGDPDAGDDNAASIANPVHVFSAAGTYQVTLKVKSGAACQASTVRKTVTIRASLRVDLGRDTTFCPGGSVRLGTALPGVVYRWQDGSAEPFFTAAEPGTYWVEVTGNNCTTRDSVTVGFYYLPTVRLGNDTLLCAGATLSLDASDLLGVTYRWQDGSTGPTYRVSRAGTYWVELSNGACPARDSIRVSYDVPRTVDLGADTTLCLGSLLRLTFPYPDLNFRWSNGSAAPELLVDQEGTYWVTYQTPGTNCRQSDSLRVSFTECLDDLRIPNVFTPNGDGYNETFEVTGAPGTTWRLVLHNRWGKRVAGYEPYRNEWQAEGLESGLYYYELTSRVSGRRFKGWVHVLR